MAIRIVRLGTARAKGEGVRLGTVRRPPRGVKKSDYAKRDFFDAWLPELAPSAELIKGLLALGEITPAKWQRFATAYKREMKEPERAHLLTALARLSRGADFSVGCYCEDYDRCHRSILREILREHGASIASDE
ncbi:MAG TPA: DUF488 family protein [Usitatibacter sp.]